MTKLITECNNFLKNSGTTYAICGGWALDLFLNKKTRHHADIDISIFEEDRKSILQFMIKKSWNAYMPPPKLKPISNQDDNKALDHHAIWAIKPGCSLIKLKPIPKEECTYTYEILNREQLNFDFIEIIFNKQTDGKFTFDPFISQGKNISRELDKAILYYDDIPYLAPEIMLFIISHPAYMESDYHKDKNHTDFNAVAPFLQKESKEWLINAFETAYPEGHRRLEQLKSDDAMNL